MFQFVVNHKEDLLHYKNIYNKNSNYIYTPSGYLSNLFNNMSNATAVFPFSSNIFMYSEGLIDYCSNESDHPWPSPSM